MSPDTSPGELSTRFGVRRVNNLPLYIVGGVMTVFLTIMALVAMDRAKQQNRPADEAQDKPGNAAMFASAIAGEQKDGFIAPAATPPMPALPDPAAPATVGVLTIVRPANPDIPPAPPSSTQNQETSTRPRTPRDEEAERIRIMKLQQFDEAVKAHTSIQTVARRSSVSGTAASVPAERAPASQDDTLAQLASVRQQIDATNRDDPTGAYRARLQQLQLLQGGAARAVAGPSDSPSTADRNDIARFAGSRQDDRWRLDAQPEAPRIPYELRAGFVIPALLISGINSELPGQIMAQVSQDVYDTPLGKWKLIPQGSRLVGSYANEIAYGQSRVLVAWQRIVFPDGKAMDIGAMPGADSAGYAGYNDRANNHYWRLFSSAFLMSAVTAGVALSQPETTSPYGRPSASSAMSEALGQQLGQVTAQLIAKNLNIAPTLEIRPGYRFNVIVTKDMTFSKPYQAFDY
jgi:type IV secretion system protein VirB10